MTDNPVLDYMVMRDMGWMIKGAANILGITGTALGLGGIGYGEWQRHKMRKMEDKRELVAAVNDTLSRRRVSDMYEMAGMQPPHIPLAVSKKISPQYQELIRGMQQQHKTAAIRDITARIFGTRKRVGRFHKYPSKKGLRTGLK